jgi:hypothetical protein
VFPEGQQQRPLHLFFQIIVFGNSETSRRSANLSLPVIVLRPARLRVWRIQPRTIEALLVPDRAEEAAQLLEFVRDAKPLPPRTGLAAAELVR